VRELEVVSRTSKAEHDAVEACVVFEATDNAKTEALTVHGLGARQVADRTGNPKVRRHRVRVG
jgi:hypothetical protein